MVKGIRTIIRRVSIYASVTGMFTLLAMMLFTTGDVIGRSFFAAPITGSYELTKYMLVIVVLLGIPYTQQMEGHVNITVFVSKLSPRGQLLVDGIVTLLSLIFFMVVAWGGLVETISSMKGGGVSDMLRIPEWPFRLLVTVGTFLLSLELLIRFITTVSELTGKSGTERDQDERY